MGSSIPPALVLGLTIVIVLAFASPAHAFGAGNIASVSQIEGTNFRHGDIEDTLLTLLTSYQYGKGAKFSKLDVKRVYFGNWLRDYSQAVDVGSVKHVSAEAIRILLWVLGFLSFGFGTGEFEVTSERLGCYRPEEHIDNPKDYADNEDARQYDRRLRGPVDEEVELAIDEETGLKNYIANEKLGIDTSAGLVRNLFGRAIQLGRQFNRSGNKADFYEALRLLGTGTHCLEDYSAHSNYTELALIELGEQDIFPHVGRRTQIRLPGGRSHPVYPIVTGTFGGVDFLHSVMGELDDKTTQSEIQELEGVMQQSQGQNTSILRKLLESLPSGLFGGKDQAGKVDDLQQSAAQAQMQNMNISPKQPEAWAQQMNKISRQIYPILEFHDEIMKGITETIDKIPVLPDLIEQVQEQISIFVFSLLAPFVLPITRQVQEELATGSSEVIQSSKDKQLVVFHDDHSSDPTHSMLSKDHFSNILNEPAGKIGCAVLRWVVPQIVSCWDDERIDADRTITRIINGIFHHPAQRNQGEDGAQDGRMAMFRVVEEWWQSKSGNEKNDLRHALSREGVETGKNHKEGVKDCGHGCGKPIGLANNSSSNAPAAAAHAAVIQGLSQAFNGQQNQGGYQSQAGYGGGSSQNAISQQASSFISDAVGGGALGGIVGGLVGGVGSSLLGGAFESSSGGETQTFQSQNYNQDGSYTSTTMQTGHRPTGASSNYDNRPAASASSGHGAASSYYGGGGNEESAQAEYKTTQYPDGGYRQEYDRFNQTGSSGYGFQESVEMRPNQGGGYSQRAENKWERPDGRWESDIQEQGVSAGGQYYQREEKHHGRRHSGRDEEDSSDSDDGGDWEKKERKRKEKERKRREKEEKKRYSGGRNSDDERKGHGNHGHHQRQHSREGNRRDDEYPGSRYGGGGGGGGGNNESFEGRQHHGNERPNEGFGQSYEQEQRPPQYGGGGAYGSQGYGEQGYGAQGYGEQSYGRPDEFGGPPHHRPGNEGFGFGGPPPPGPPGGFGGYDEPPPREYGGGGGEFPGAREEQRRRNEGGGGYGGGGYGGGGGGW